MSKFDEFTTDEINALHSLIVTRRNEMMDEGFKLASKHTEAFAINSLLFDLEDHIAEIVAGRKSD